MATIQGVYIALFGRPADPAGLAYFNGVTNNGANLASIGNLSGQPEYTARFTGQSNVQIVNSIYQSLFGRDAEAAGLEFFTSALAAGRLNINNVAINILDGAQGDDKLVVTNKLKAADTFTAALDTGTERAAYVGTAAADQGRTFLAPITKDVATIPTAAATDAAVLKLVSVSTGGVALTTDGTAAQAISPTATDAKFKSTGGDDTITATAVSTANTKIDGGFGVDTVNASVAANWAPPTDAIKNVENLFLKATAGVTVDLDKVSGLKQVWNDGSAANALVVTNINSAATLGVKDAAAVVSFAFKEAQTGTTNVALNKAVVTTSLTITNGSDTVAVANTGPSSVAGFADADVKNVSVTGSGDLTFSLNAATVKLAKFDASALDGKLTVDFSNGTVGVTVTGTKNVDAITLKAANALTDVVAYNKAETSTFASVEKISNFVVDADPLKNDKIDLKAFGFTKTGVTTFTNVIENASFGTSSVAIGVDGGVEYVFADTNGDGKLNLATDFAVQLVGHAAADLTAANFVLA